MSTRPKYDPFQYIRDTYRVPARKEQRIELTFGGVVRTGRIIGCQGQYLRFHFDGCEKPANGVFHPTDGVRYLDHNNKPVTA